MSQSMDTSEKTRAKWIQQALQSALRAVENGQSIKSAARDHSMPRKTLSDYVKRGNGAQKLHIGSRMIFSAEQEQELVTRIKRLQQVGFPLTRSDIRRTAYELVVSLKIEQWFGKLAMGSKLAGKDWFGSFLGRHGDLSARKTEILSYGRGAGLNRTVVNEFYELLKTVSSEKIAPFNMFNMDETGLQLTTRQGYVIAQKGSKRVPQLSSGEKGKTVSVVACCSATGVFLPPYVIFKGVRRREELGDGLPPGSEFSLTDSGYAQTQTFKLFMEFFVKHVAPGEKKLLIMDGHRSHVDAEAVEVAERNNVIIMLRPAHTSHELQSLDKAVFKSLKAAFYEQSRYWHQQHPGRSLNKLTFSSIFTPAWNKSANRENAVKGFQATGIYPINPHAIADSAFAPSDLLSVQTIMAIQLPKRQISLHPTQWSQLRVHLKCTSRVQSVPNQLEARATPLKSPTTAMNVFSTWTLRSIALTHTGQIPQQRLKNLTRLL